MKHQPRNTMTVNVKHIKLSLILSLTALLLAAAGSLQALPLDLKRIKSTGVTNSIQLDFKFRTTTLSIANSQDAAAESPNNAARGITTSYYMPEAGLSFLHSRVTGIMWKTGLDGGFLPQAYRSAYKQTRNINPYISKTTRELITPQGTGVSAKVYGMFGYSFSDVFFMAGLGGEGLYLKSDEFQNVKSKTFKGERNQIYVGIYVPLQVGWNLAWHEYFFMQVYAQYDIALKRLPVKFDQNIAVVHRSAMIGLNMGVPF